jgi:pyrimidine operon attenuation protein/uracil phosphoribosyltransferase
MGTPKKIFIAVYCDDEAQAAQVQDIAKDMSSTFQIQAKDIIGLYPLVKKNRSILRNAINAIAKDKMAGAMKVLPSLVGMFFKK